MNEPAYAQRYLLTPTEVGARKGTSAGTVIRWLRDDAIRAERFPHAELLGFGASRKRWGIPPCCADGLCGPNGRKAYDGPKEPRELPRLLRMVEGRKRA